MEVHFPSQILSPFISRYLVMESHGEMVNRTLPDTSLVMSFRYKGQVRFLNQGTAHELSSFTLSGLRKTDRLINYSSHTANILVIFREAAAHAFIKEPLHELFEHSVPLDNFTGYRHLDQIGEQLSAARSNTERITLVEQFLLSKICNGRPDPLITAALQKIHTTKGAIKIKELAGALYISQDAFEKRFRSRVGVSPKQFAYIVKMRSVISGAMEGRSLAAIAFDAGYYDQPHFNKDFKLFTGQTPTEFLKSPVVM